jgi:hypothetical protein
MISDILSDAVDDIERCQRDFPACYAETGDEIEAVKAAMDALRGRPPQGG